MIWCFFTRHFKLVDVLAIGQHVKLLMHPSYSERLLYIYSNRSKQISIAFVTDDSGISWTKHQLSETFFDQPYLDNILFNPRNKDGLFTTTFRGLLESKDLGLSWTLIKKLDNSEIKTASDNVYVTSSNGIFNLFSPIVSIEDIDCLFNWAQQQYPNVFRPTSADSQIFEDYSYRYYSDTNTYLGVFQNQKIHLLQADLTDEIQDVGYFEYFQHLSGCNNSEVK